MHRARRHGDSSEKLISCCACSVTGNTLKSLLVHNDLLTRTLTPIAPTAITIRLIASDAAAGACNGASPTISDLVGGPDAWRTTLHALPSTAVNYGLTETPFSNAALSPAELNHVVQFCAFTEINGTGYGQCSGCNAGGL